MGSDAKLCWIGRAAQKLCCMPEKSVTTTPAYHQIAIHPADNDSVYSNDIKYKPGLRLPSPQPDEPEPQTTPHMAIYQHRSPQIPKSPKKTPVARTVPLSTLQLPVHSFPVHTPAATCVTLNVDLPPVLPTAQTPHTSYLVPLSAVPRTPYQDVVPDSVIQDLKNVAPTQYVWNTPHGALTYTPGPTSHLPLHNTVPNLSPYFPCVVDMGNGDDGSTGLGLISIASSSSDSSSDCSDPDYRGGIKLHQVFASNRHPEGTDIEWNVSDPVDMARHRLDNASFIAYASAPATEPPINELRIDFCFLDQPGVRWNWEPILVRKRRPIRITDVLHAIHDYFQTQLTHSEYDIIKSHGKRNARIVANSWRERVISEFEGDMQSTVYRGGLRRVDCLGSSKIFAGLWVEGSQLKLGLRA